MRWQCESAEDNKTICFPKKWCLIWLQNKCDGRLPFEVAGPRLKNEVESNKSIERKAHMQAGEIILFVIFDSLAFVQPKIEYINNKHEKHLSQLRIRFQEADNRAQSMMNF